MNRSTWVHHYLLDLRTNPLKLSTFSLKSFTLLVLEKLRRPEKGLLTSLWGGREQLVKRPEFWLISRWPEWAFNFLIRISRTVEAIEDSADSTLSGMSIEQRRFLISSCRSPRFFMSISSVYGNLQRAHLAHQGKMWSSYGAHPRFSRESQDSRIESKEMKNWWLR